jgi:hypothetical protein
MDWREEDWLQGGSCRKTIEMVYMRQVKSKKKTDSKGI